MGVDQSVLNGFMNLLARCNIFTMGALRAFHASMEELVGAPANTVRYSYILNIVIIC